MIAADTSAWIDHFKGQETLGARRLAAALDEGILMMPWPVCFELLSGPGITHEVAGLVRSVPVLELQTGFWERAAQTRRALLRKGRRARSMDCLIAQTCIDHGVALIASDSDFRPFVKAGLRLVPT